MKTFGLEIYLRLHHLILKFYQIIRNDEIRTRDRLVIKTLILYKKNKFNPKI